MNTRADLEALCEWQAMERFRLEQESVGNVWKQVYSCALRV